MVNLWKDVYKELEGKETKVLEWRVR